MMLMGLTLWGTIWWTVGIVVGLGVIWFLQMLYVGMVMLWCDKNTKGLAYYGKTLEGRRRFKQKLKRQRLLASPALWLMQRTQPFDFSQGRCVVQGISGPKGTCSEEDFQKGVDYSPKPNDIFVVSQMKSGTTWLQQLVIQILVRGGESPIDQGATLYAVSPWLESGKTVALEDAPLIGEQQPSRVIKTHFPVAICPIASQAKYIYVARHPVSCFASCVDFVRSNLGGFSPDLPAYENWFRSPKQMWWGTWPAHVGGWWKQSKDENVLFVQFESMKTDLEKVAVQIVEFLGLDPFSKSAMDSVLRKCSFQFMKENAEHFEMHPPHILQSQGKFFVSGKKNRFMDIPEETRERIAQWGREELEQLDVPVVELYPKL